MNRSKRVSIAQQTLDIVDRGWYEIDGFGRVEIDKQVNACLKATALFRPEDHDRPSDWDAATRGYTEFDVRNETTLTAAQRLVAERGLSNVMLLNFASAKNPGGGFLGGSQAQEESLARSSALYASLQTQPEYYEANQGCRTALYTDHMILSHGVPVFRGDDGRLLAAPYAVGMLTSPAVNAGAVKDNEPANIERILPTMASRIDKVLAVAMAHGYKQLVLGAWGCGVFRNDSVAVAGLYEEALLGEGTYANTFHCVTFAVLDSTADETIIRPFQRRFDRVKQ